MNESSMGMNKYGMSAKHLQGKFYAYKDGKMTGGPFHSIDDLSKHQQEILDKMDNKDED